MQKVVITGASGFLGNHTARQLIGDGYAVTALLRESSSTDELPVECEPVRVNFMKPDTISPFLQNAVAILHIAGATAAGSLEEFDRANALVTKNMISARNATSPEAVFIYVSSVAAAGPNENGPITAYGCSKLLGEKCTETTDNWIIVRPPGIFGPGDYASRSSFRLAGKGLFISPGISQSKFPIIYVADVAALLSILVDCSRATGKIITPYYKKLYSWSEFHGEIEQALSKRILHLRIPAPFIKLGGFISEVSSALLRNTPFFTLEKTREILADYTISHMQTDIETMTGWRADTPLRDALKKTLEWAGR